MPTATPRLALQLNDTELARFVSLLSHEAAGVALRILDIQFRTGAGLPDSRSTHHQLGIPKRRWDMLREELLRLFESEGGSLIYKPALERAQKKDAARRAGAAAGAKTKAEAKAARRPGIASIGGDPSKPMKAAETPKQVAHTQTGQGGPAGAPRSTVDPDAGAPVPPFAVIDEANRKIAETPNVVPLKPAAPPVQAAQTASAKSTGRKPAQPMLPGMAKNSAAEAGQPDDIPTSRKSCFDVGLKLLTRYNGMTEEQARHRIGKLLTQWEPHYVHAAILDASRHRNDIVNPVGWIANRLKDFPDKAAERAARVAKVTGKGAKPAATKQAPKVTPKFMGISKEKADRLRAKSEELRRPVGAATDGNEPVSRPQKAANDQAPHKSDEQIFGAMAF